MRYSQSKNMEKNYWENTETSKTPSGQIRRRDFFGLAVSAILISGCGPGDYGWLWKVSTDESRMIDVWLAPDLPTAKTRLKQYRDYINTWLENDENGALWSSILKEYQHDESTVFLFLLREGLFQGDTPNYTSYKNLSSRVARSKKR